MAKKKDVYIAPVGGTHPVSIQNGDFHFKFAGNPPWKVTQETLALINKIMPGLIKTVSSKWKPKK